jgi:hypothetical protein
VTNAVVDGSGQLYNTVLHRVGLGGGLYIHGVHYTTSCMTQSTDASFICIESRIEDFLSQHDWKIYVIMFHYDNEVYDASIRHAPQPSFHRSDLLSRQSLSMMVRLTYHLVLN